jgi:hypothetical protein
VITPQFVGGLQPQWHLEVDAARLLLILNQFARPLGADSRRLSALAKLPFVRHFAFEYYLQKLDFLLRYPRYFAFELIELHGSNDGPASDAAATIETIRKVLGDKEPELHTEPFVRFWRGAYERLDDVEGWWFSRELVCMGRETRGNVPRWKHYFLTAKGEEVAGRLKEKVDHARWYARRIEEIHRFMGHLSAANIKGRQYRHQGYSEANLNQLIPDLTDRDISDNFEQVFREPLGVPLG